MTLVTHLSIFRTILSIAVLVVVALVQSGCSTTPMPAAAKSEPAQVSAAAQTKPTRSPLRIALIQDKSLSTGETRTPQLKVEDLDPLLELLGLMGGELAVGIIHDRSNLAFARLRIDAGPEEPAAVVESDNPFERRDQRAAQRKLKEKFEEREQSWREDMQTRIGEFQGAVDPMLSMAADANHSPVWDAVKRADLFLSESDSDGNTEPRRYAVLITDGIDDVGARPVPINSRTRILVVNGAGQLGALAVLKPQRFESIAAAVRYIVGLETK